ncbi:unnamed protein product [Peniophora sp. CBMAI 1063]|nr:unnamed protein product [Peniophora sp. CBMAI 1063]
MYSQTPQRGYPPRSYSRNTAHSSQFNASGPPSLGHFGTPSYTLNNAHTTSYSDSFFDSAGGGGADNNAISSLTIAELVEAENPAVLALVERCQRLEEEKLAAEREVIRAEGRIEELHRLLDQPQHHHITASSSSRFTAPQTDPLPAVPKLDELIETDYPAVLNWHGITKDENAAELAGTSTGTEMPVVSEDGPATAKLPRGVHKFKRTAPDGTKNIGMKWLVKGDGNNQPQRSTHFKQLSLSAYTV